jgi:hypothetical protein
MTLVVTILLRLQLRTASLSACKPVFGSTLTAASAYNTESSGISAALLDCMGDLCALAFLSGLKRLVISTAFNPSPFLKMQLSDLISEQDISIAEFNGLGTEYKCVFSNLNWKKRQDGYKAL